MNYWKLVKFGVCGRPFLKIWSQIDWNAHAEDFYISLKVGAACNKCRRITYIKGFGLMAISVTIVNSTVQK